MQKSLIFLLFSLFANLLKYDVSPARFVYQSIGNLILNKMECNTLGVSHFKQYLQALKKVYHQKKVFLRFRPQNLDQGTKCYIYS